LSTFEEGLFSVVKARDESSVLPVYLGLFVLGHVWQLLLGFDAVLAKNIIQVLGLCLFNTLFLVYSFIEIIEIKSLVAARVVGILIWVIPGMIGLTELVYLSTTYWIYSEFGWSIYKTFGPNLAVKRAHAWYQYFLCLLKFDYFFFIAFCLQLVLLVLDQSHLERWMTVAAVPTAFILLILGYLAVKREQRFLLYFFLLGCVAGAAYFVFKLFRIYERRATDYALVFKSLTLFAGLCLAALLATFTIAIVCLHHFGSDLKVKLKESAGSSSKLERMSMY